MTTKGRLPAMILALVLVACAPDSDAPTPSDAESRDPVADGTPLASDTVLPVDPSIPPAIAGQDGWDYQLSADSDLTGDGRAERVVLTARVELIRGRPAWDDGQPWQVYVEGVDGTRTYLYARRLQLGTLAMRVTRPEPGEPAAVILIEHLPDRLTLYEARYRARGDVSVIQRFQREVDPRGELASPSLP